MKIIYHCFGGTHSSVTAAAAHLGRLPRDRSPRPGELLSIPFFDTRERDDHGTITLMGIDEKDNHVYFAGQRGRPDLLENIINGLARNFAIPTGDYKLVNVMHKINISMRLGGTMSRRFRWVDAGRPLVTLGTVWAYPSIINLVRSAIAEENTGQ